MCVEAGVKRAGDMDNELWRVGQAEGENEPVMMLKAGVQFES